MLSLTIYPLADHLEIPQTTSTENPVPYSTPSDTMLGHYSPQSTGNNLITLLEYAERKFLSMPRDGVNIIPILDIGDTVESGSDSDSEKEGCELHNVQIIWHPNPHLNSYKSCKARVEPSTSPLSRCSMLQRFDMGKKILHGFGKIVQDLAEVATVMMTHL